MSSTISESTNSVVAMMFTDGAMHDSSVEDTKVASAAMFPKRHVLLSSFLKLTPRIRTTNPPSAEPLRGVTSEIYGSGRHSELNRFSGHGTGLVLGTVLGDMLMDGWSDGEFEGPVDGDIH